MQWMRLVVVGALTTGCAWPEDIVRRQITSSDAVVLLADRAFNKPRIEIFTKNGQKLKGRLIDATNTGIRLERRPVVDICSAQWVRLPGAAAKPRRIARGMVAGGFAMVYVFVRLALGTKSGLVPHPAVMVPIIGLGGAAGGRLAERGQDILYIVSPGPPGGLCSDQGGPPEDRPEI